MHWAKVPLPKGATDELYFNPILGMFSQTKPNLVRGGMICEQMGMGKSEFRSLSKDVAVH